jgi:hypothetical protein
MDVTAVVQGMRQAAAIDDGFWLYYPDGERHDARFRPNGRLSVISL